MLSIVIPAYNLEDYIKETLDEFIEFGDDIEVIIVNDGSNDNTENEVVRIIENKKNFKLINTSNMGVSSARNIGINLAKHKNIMFLDGDDILNKESLRNILKNLKLHEHDMYYFEFNDWFETGKIVTYKQLGFKGTNYNRPLNALIDKISRKIWLGIGNVIYNINFLKENSLCFDTNSSYGEDIEFINKALFKCKNLFFIENSKLIVRNRNGSVTRSKFNEKKLNALSSNRQFYQYVRESNIGDREKKIILDLVNEDQNLTKRYICNSIIETYYNYDMKDIKKILKSYNLLKLEEVKKRSIRKGNIIAFLKDSIYTSNPLIYVFLYKFKICKL